MQLKAPEVLALKVSPAPSNALPLEQMPRNEWIKSTGKGGDNGIGRDVDDGNCVVRCIGHVSDGSVRSDHYAGRLRSYGDGGDHRLVAVLMMETLLLPRLAT